MPHFVFTYSCDIHSFAIQICTVCPCVEGMALSDKQHTHGPWPQGTSRLLEREGFFVFQLEWPRKLCWDFTSVYNPDLSRRTCKLRQSTLKTPKTVLWNIQQQHLLVTSSRTHFKCISTQRNFHNLLSVTTVSPKKQDLTGQPAPTRLLEQKPI